MNDQQQTSSPTDYLDLVTVTTKIQTNLSLSLNEPQAKWLKGLMDELPLSKEENDIKRLRLAISNALFKSGIK